MQLEHRKDIESLQNKISEMKEKLKNKKDMLINLQGTHTKDIKEIAEFKYFLYT